MHKKIYMIGFVGLILDQFSKMLVDTFVDLNSNISLIGDFFSLKYIRNTGAAWGILSNNTLFLALISIVFLFLFIRYINNEKEISKISELSFGLVFGGIIGNLIDRLFRTYVIDFLSFNFFGYHFPVFNIADILIVVAVILLLIECIIVGDDKSDSRRRKKKN